MKRKFTKTLVSFLLAAFLSINAAPVSLAIEPLELHMEKVVAGEGELFIYCNTNAEQPTTMDGFAVTLGNDTLPVKNVVTLESSAQSTSYIFLVDASGSITKSHFQAIKSTLTAIAGQLGEDDNISIVDIGNETYTQPFVTGLENIQAQIDAIVTRGENTNLYESINKSLAILETHEDCYDKKVLIIFSDGEEYNVKGITQEEVNIKIDEAHIPIYTVAMLGKNPRDEYVETAKILGSFARLSAGGRHYIHTVDEATTQTIADDIMSAIRNSLIVTTDLSEFYSDGNEMNLRLELTVTGLGKATDSYDISTSGLSAEPVESTEMETTEETQTTEETETTEATTDETTTETETTDEGGGFLNTGIPHYIVWIIGGAVALLAVVLVLVICLRSKKKQTPMEPPVPIEAPVPESEADLPKTVAIQPTTLLSPPPGKPRIALRLTKVGPVEEEVYRAEFAGELIIGRSSAKAALYFPKDDLLSAAHCSISYMPEGIILSDLGSTNGTFVNGVPVKERYTLEKDDILLIGSMEVRVNWEPIENA
ncbi:MAG: VWA domain-containing protein [Clostridium sp.]|nr:VWA domain-containing protein [Clostridium sp.]